MTVGRLFDALDAATGEPPPFSTNPGWSSGSSPRCPNCGAAGLPSEVWHYDPDTDTYQCGAP